MKEKIEIFKTIWKNPRYHAIIELVLFFIFFFGIFLFFKLSPKTERVIYTNPLEQFRDKSSYQFELKINNEIIEGTFIDNLIKVNYYGVEYIYKDGVIEPMQFPYIATLEYIDTKHIYNLIINKEVYSKTEYNDGTISKVYQLDNLDIEIYELNNEINQIKFKSLDYEFELIYK